MYYCRLALLSRVALFTRAWIEIKSVQGLFYQNQSPSSRGRGLKFNHFLREVIFSEVALFTRAWIEIGFSCVPNRRASVALFTRAWIEIENL